MIADVEAREMIELEPVGIAEQRLEVGRGIVAVRAEADQMLVAVAVGQLDQAQPVAAGDQAHRLGVDGDRAVGERARRRAGLPRGNGRSFNRPQPCRGTLLAVRLTL